MVRYTLFLLTLFLLISCGQQEKEVAPLGVIALSSAEAPAKWPFDDLPLNLEISTSFSDDDAIIQGMGDEWETIGNNELQFFTYTSGVANKDYTNLDLYRDSSIGLYKSTQWFSEISSYALAITQFFGYRRNAGTSNEYIELTHGDIIVNYKNFSFSSDLSFGTYDLPSVVLHEMGHLIGLYHIYDDPAIMSPTISSQTAERTGYEADEIALARNYGINQTVIPFTPAGASSTKVIYSDPSQEGELVYGHHELLANGTCNLYIDGRLVEEHERHYHHHH